MLAVAVGAENDLCGDRILRKRLMIDRQLPGRNELANINHGAPSRREEMMRLLRLSIHRMMICASLLTHC